MEKKIIVLATSNQHKVTEMNFLLSKYGYKIISLSDLNLKIDKEETGKTFQENALIKARDISKRLGVGRKEINSRIYRYLLNYLEQDDNFKWRLKKKQSLKMWNLFLMI